MDGRLGRREDGGAGVQVPYPSLGAACEERILDLILSTELSRSRLARFEVERGNLSTGQGLVAFP